MAGRVIGGSLEEGLVDINKMVGTSPLEALREELKQDVYKEPLIQRVETRKNIKIRYDTNIDFEFIEKLTISATNKKTKEVNQLRVGISLLSSQAEAILFTDQEVLDDHNEPINLRSMELVKMVGAIDQRTAIRKFFGSDAHLLAHVNKVLAAAGYDPDLMELEDDEDNPLD